MLVHEMIISVMDNGQIKVIGIPENLEISLLLIHNLTRVVIGYHLDRAIRQKLMQQYLQNGPESILMN